MKLVHANKESTFPKDFADCLQKAKEAAASNNLEEAISLYKHCIKLKPTYENGYDRLMILYRKNKEYKKEMAIINDGIKVFENLYKKAVKKTLNRTAVQLSKSLLKATGLADKNGKEFFEQPPISRWRQRATLVKKRLGA